MAKHVGQLKIKRVSRIRDAIYDIMSEGMIEHEKSDVFLSREVLFYTLVEQGLDTNSATYFATKVYGSGRQVTSRWLKEVFAGTSNELGQKQFTKFISKYMHSSRIELLNNAPYVWRMNGFKSFESPYIAGFKMCKSIKRKCELVKQNKMIEA